MFYSTPQTKQQIDGAQISCNDMEQTDYNNYILCGRGKINAKHTGNKIFAKIIQSNIAEYIKTDTKIGKVIVVASVVDFIHGNGMKFVTYNALTKTYVELSSERIHTKVSHAIRDQMKQQNRKSDLRSSGAVRAGKEQKRRAVGPDNLSLNRDSKKDDGFDAWWSQHKNECCEKIVLSCNSSPPTATSRIEESPACKSVLDHECDFLAFSRTIFNLGATIEETSTCINSSRLFEKDIQMREEEPIKISEEMSSKMYSLPLFPTSSIMQEEQEEDGSPLPVDSVPEFEGEGVRDMISLILEHQEDNEYDEEIELLPLVANPVFPDHCCSSQKVF